MRATCTLFILLAATFASAQIQKGNFIVGGNINFNHASYGGTTTYGLSITPTAYYFLGSKLAGGLMTSLEFTGTKYGSTSNTKTQYSIGPAFRYYFPIRQRWALFPEIAYLVGENQSRDGSNSAAKTNISSISTFQSGVGVTYFLTQHVGIEGLANYKVVDTSGFNTNAITVRLGVQIYLGKS